MKPFGHTKLSSHEKTLRLTQMAILTAVTIVLAFFPIPFFGFFSMTLAPLPVAIGAILLGPVSGLFLGSVWGICSFITCFGLDVNGALMLNMQPVFTFLTAVPTRALVGLLSGLLFLLLSKLFQNTKNDIVKETLPVTIAAFMTPVLNTILFISAYTILFLYTGIFENTYGTNNLFMILAASVGLQAIIEFLIVTVIAPTVILSLRHFLHAKH